MEIRPEQPSPEEIPTRGDLAALWTGRAVFTLMGGGAGGMTIAIAKADPESINVLGWGAATTIFTGIAVVFSAIYDSYKQDKNAQS